MTIVSRSCMLLLLNAVSGSAAEASRRTWTTLPGYEFFFGRDSAAFDELL